MSTATESRASSTTIDGVEIARRRNPRGALLTVFTWILALGFFFPVLWMVLTAFKKESDAATNPPTFIFTPTLEQFKEVFDAGIGTPLMNSLFATIVSTILVLALGVPAAFALSL
ncbi:carbohydrate ABC transporter permease, partial [Streptomyces sp. SID10244]|nr:carbohydrate ABC transporter permease [Streptomyces sp. SID10244]